MNDQQWITGINPVIPMDFPDPDIIRVGETYYMVSTTMYFMPGCVILRSYDLIHWEYCARVYDQLDDTPKQHLEQDQHAYGKGMWAASLRYHDGTFYICFVANDTGKTYLYRARDISGPWTMNHVDGFYHDCSLLFDDDGRKYITYGNAQIHLTELNDELTAPREGGLNRIIADSGKSDYLGFEGSHFYKINNRYYLFVIHSLKDQWKRVESCFSSNSLTGDFTGGIIFDDDMAFHNQGVAQGGIVDTPDHRWYCFLFQDRGAVGRVPVLLPMHWENGLPVIGTDGKALTKIGNDSTRPDHSYAPLWGSDSFDSPAMQPWWEWNHIPDLDLCSWGKGQYTITTGKSTDRLTQAINTLTQRGVYPFCRAEVTIDGSLLMNGDHAGLCVLQDLWAWIGLEKQDGQFWIVYRVKGPEDPVEGRVLQIIPTSTPMVRVRAEMDFTDLRDMASFHFLNGDEWIPAGEPHHMEFRLSHFTGNRFGLFCYSSLQAGGSASFSNFVYAIT